MLIFAGILITVWTIQASQAETALRDTLGYLHGANLCSDCMDDDDLHIVIENIQDVFPCTPMPDCPCLTALDVYRITGANGTVGICEDEFPRVALLLFLHANNANATCSTYDTYDDYVASVMDMLEEGEHIEHGLEEILEVMMKKYHIEEESHKHEGHEEDEDHEAHEDEEGHDHEVEEGHDHKDEKGHDHDEEGHDHEDEGHDHEDEENHDHDNEEGHDHAEHADEHIIKCFSAERIMESAKINLTATNITQRQLETVTSHIIMYLVRGFRYSPSCKDLPEKALFSSSVFSQLGVQENQVLHKAEFEKLLAQLKIGTSFSTVEVHDDHAGHDHERRKRATDSIITTCYDAASLLAIYDADSGITQRKFSEICPALVQQQMSGACQQNVTQPSTIPESTLSDAQRYGYGLVAVILVSLCSLIGLLIVPCANRAAQNDVLGAFMGLAVGSLTSDALIHLIPAALGVHGHDGEEHAHAHGDQIVIEPYTKTGLVILTAIYAFFALESIMDSLLSGDRGDGGHGHSHVMIENGNNSKQDLMTPNDSPSGSQVITTKKGLCGIKSVAWMVLLGDGIHNFADGLAIGAAFSVGFKDGLATSIAVLCHELPHEFGDFAVLINSGMSYKMAALLNLISALTSIIGLFVGSALAADPQISIWIFTVVSGMFLYIALADMVPELIKVQQTATTGCVWLRRYLLETFGFAIGVLALTVIAVFEERIKFA